jgi:hypothetical protein
MALALAWGGKDRKHWKMLREKEGRRSKWWQ